MHPNRRWRASQSRARSPRMHHASYPVFVHRPAVSDWTSFRPRLATTALPFSLPSALRKPGYRTFTYKVTRHARRTRSRSTAAEGGRLRRVVMRQLTARSMSLCSSALWPRRMDMGFGFAKQFGHLIVPNAERGELPIYVLKIVQARPHKAGAARAILYLLGAG